MATVTYKHGTTNEIIYSLFITKYRHVVWNNENEFFVFQMLLRLRESGIITFHLHDVLRRRADFNLREILVEYDGKDGSVRVLTLVPLGAAFFLLLLGLSISTLVFYLEIKYNNDSKSIREVLRDVNRKRRSYSTSTGKKQL